MEMGDLQDTLDLDAWYENEAKMRKQQKAHHDARTFISVTKASDPLH
jgi:hypothetical protein